MRRSEPQIAIDVQKPDVSLPQKTGKRLQLSRISEIVLFEYEENKRIGSKTKTRIEKLIDQGKVESN
jgi:hypothetical protein